MIPGGWKYKTWKMKEDASLRLKYNTSMLDKPLRIRSRHLAASTVKLSEFADQWDQKTEYREYVKVADPSNRGAPEDAKKINQNEERQIQMEYCTYPIPGFLCDGSFLYLKNTEK